jgi:DNA-binding beta-propeller fold protein YncE
MVNLYCSHFSRRAPSRPGRGLTLHWWSANRTSQLALVDPETEKVLVKLPTGGGPHEVAVSPDGRTAYVSDFGRFSVYPPGDATHNQAGHTITVVDVVSRKVKATFDLGTYTGPHGLAISHHGKYVWVTSETPQSVLLLDSHTGKIPHAWKTNQQRSHMVVVMPNETKLYVANTVSGSVSVIDRILTHSGERVTDKARDSLLLFVA